MPGKCCHLTRNYCAEMMLGLSPLWLLDGPWFCFLSTAGRKEKEQEHCRCHSTRHQIRLVWRCYVNCARGSTGVWPLVPRKNPVALYSMGHNRFSLSSILCQRESWLIVASRDKPHSQISNWPLKREVASGYGEVVVWERRLLDLG